MKWVEKSGMHHLGDGHRSQITVLHHRDHGPKVWCVTCYDLGLGAQPLTSTSLDGAKDEALRVAAKSLRSSVAYYKKLGIVL